MRKTISPILVSIVICAAIFSFDYGSLSPEATGDLEDARVVPLTIKVILVGPYFNSRIIDVSLLNSLIPQNKSNLILVDEMNTGVSYNFSYEFSFATSSFMTEMIQFLKTIEEQKEQENPWFYLYEEQEDWFVTVPAKIEAYIYDAKAVENWLIERMDEFGGFPENGYVFVIADLRDLPSISYNEMREFLTARTYGVTPSPVRAHYYGLSYTDLDRGYSLRYRDLAVGWGGSERMWFLDLSAGPTFVSPWLDLPIQVVEKDQGVDPYTSLGVSWLTELLGDYIMEFVYNLAAPNFVYTPLLSRKYRIEVNIFDYRINEERELVPIRRTFDASIVQGAVKTLVPYSDVEVNVQFMNVSEYTDLDTLMRASRGFLNSWIHKYLFLEPMNLSYIDAVPIYEYLKKNMDRYVPNSIRDENEYVVPVFAFALGDDTHFSFKYKWLVMKPGLETGAIWGAAFRELILVGFSQRDFLRGNYVEPKQEDRGFGFTQAVIHEVGHALGLMHPHTYSDLGDFVNSAMSYYAYEYNFSVFDRDALQRIHVDRLASELLRKIIQVKGASARGIEPKEGISSFMNRVTTLLTAVDHEYSRMNYTGSLNIAFEASAYVDEVLSEVREAPSSIEELISELKDKMMEIKRLNETYATLQTEHSALKESYDDMRRELSDLKDRNARLEEDLLQTRLIQYVFLSAAVAFLALAIFVSRKKWASTN